MCLRQLTYNTVGFLVDSVIINNIHVYLNLCMDAASEIYSWSLIIQEYDKTLGIQVQVFLLCLELCRQCNSKLNNNAIS